NKAGAASACQQRDGLARHLRRWLGRVDCLGQRGPCKPAPLRRRLLLIDSRAFRVLSGILAPLGNSTNRRTNSPQISTTYFVPTSGPSADQKQKPRASSGFLPRWASLDIENHGILLGFYFIFCPSG